MVCYPLLWRGITIRKLLTEYKNMITCDNTNHKGQAKNVKKVRLNSDFDNEECYWCEKCRERDEEMILSTN
jgi:hypothetical protein